MKNLAGIVVLALKAFIQTILLYNKLDFISLSLFLSLFGAKGFLARTGNEPIQPPRLLNPDIKNIWKGAAQR